MFEKIIITCDDPILVVDKKKKADLNSKCYRILEVGYSKDIDIVRDIVERRFEFDEETRPRFPMEKVSDDDFASIVERCGGNLDTVLETFMNAEKLHRWNESKDISTVVDEACTQKVKDVKQYRKIVKVLKLYL